MVLKCGGPLVNTVIQSRNVGNKLHISRLKSIFWEDIKQLPQQNVFCRWIGETTSGSASVTKKLFLFFLMNTVLLSVLWLWRDCAENFLFRKKKHTSLSEPVEQNCISTSFVDISTSLHIEEKNFLLIFFFSHPWPSYSSVRVLLSAILSFSPNSVRLDLRTHPQSDINLFLARKQTKRVQRFLLKKVWWHCDKNERVVYALWCFFVWRRSTFLEMLAVSHTNTHTQFLDSCFPHKPAIMLDLPHFVDSASLKSNDCQQDSPTRLATGIFFFQHKGESQSTLLMNKEMCESFEKISSTRMKGLRSPPVGEGLLRLAVQPLPFAGST